ncbi:MAG: hypothetical protein HC888_01265 [Candidatus Competibacteraceae bacterium]|nr:hypothetical protein [Candidatus Competibacteraceae bacterium]
MKKLLLPIIALFAFSLPATAAFVLVDDFTGLTNGDIAGQNGWVGATGNSSFDVGADPANSSNKVLISLARDGSGTDNHSVAKNFASSIAEGATGTLFLRLRFDTTANLLLDTLTGATQTTAASVTNATTDYANYGSLSETPSDPDTGGSLRAWETSIIGNSTVASLASDTWYNMWIVFDNTADQADLLPPRRQFRHPDASRQQFRIS